MDKIVLIEDDPGIRTVIRLALKGAGFTSICEAGNGTDGLALVQREKPALAILDLMLPGMDGLAVCSAIRRTSSVSGTPIVMLTAYPAASSASLRHFTSRCSTSHGVSATTYCASPFRTSQ